MDSNVLISAINKAISGGAIAAPRIDVLGEDVSYVRTQTDVGIETAVFEAYMTDLRVDADIAAFDEIFANSPIGGGISVSLSNIARLLLARAIASNDVPGTVARFISFVVENAAKATAVMAVSGVKTAGPIKLGPDVFLIPITKLPPSQQRGVALGKDPLSPSRLGAIPTALTTKFIFRPVFYRPKNPQPPEEMAAHLSAGEAQSLLAEAFDLLSVLGIYPNFRMFWVQPDDWLMSAGMSSSWRYSSSEDRLWEEVEVPVREAEALGAAYFSLDPQIRNKMLRIPLDRLGRAGRERDLADRTIDLGIALESLLLHDIEDHGELRFRLSLRGAWLIGHNDTERLEIQRTLQKLYDLRSRAVHRGFVEGDANTRSTIKRATEICRALIRKLVDLRCKVDWQKTVIGG